MASNNVQTNTADAGSSHSLEIRPQAQDSASEASDAGSSTIPVPRTGGFGSYREYLKSILGEFPEYQDLFYYFAHHDDGRVVDDEIPVLLVQEIDGALKSSFLQSNRGESRESLEDPRTRVVVVSGDNVSGDNFAGPLSFIGLLYDVDPAFFLAAPIHVWDNLDNPLIPVSGPPKIFQLHGKMAAQVLKYRNAAGQELSVGKFDVSLMKMRSNGTTNSSAVLAVVELPPFPRPIIERRPPGPHSQIRSDLLPVSKYSRYLTKSLIDYYTDMMCAWHQDQIQAASIDPVLYIQPLIKLLAEDLSIKSLNLRHLHRKVVSSKPEKEGVALLELVVNATELLCSELHDFDLFIQDFRDFRKSDAQVLSTSWKDLVSYCSAVLKDGRRTARLVRDTLHTNISLWSIRDSNRSIEEAGSVKRLTQLAFIFVPLSFVTSFFGMNVQELSGEGIKIWIFLVTAVCVGVLTILFWRLLSPIQRWWKLHPPRKPFGWILFKVILTNGYLLGAIKSGAIIGFLTSGRFGPDVQALNSREYYFRLYEISQDH